MVDKADVLAVMAYVPLLIMVVWVYLIAEDEVFAVGADSSADGVLQDEDGEEW